MVTYPDRTVVTLPDDYLVAIGKVCVQWGMLEQVVDKALHKFGDVNMDDWRPPVFTAHMSWPQKMNILDALVDGLVGEYPALSRYKIEVAPVLRKAQSGRNRIVHAFWGYDDKTASAHILSLTARGKLKTSVDPIGISDIDSIADEIALAGMLLWKLLVGKLQ